MNKNAPNRIETQNAENQDTIYLRTTKPMLRPEDRIYLVLKKKIMTKKKTTLPFFRNLDLKKVKVEAEKVNNWLTNIPTSNINELKRINLCRSETSLW